MTKEQYFEKKEEINTKIRALKDDLSNLDKSYIEANQNFYIGEKVILDKGNKKERFAFISDIEIIFNKIRYTCNKPKKDGTMSGIYDYTDINEEIFKID